MKFGVREICNVVFRAKSPITIGGHNYEKSQPVLYIDTAKTSTLEGAATTVYAQGGRGNTRLIAWEGEKTLTFTVEDALLSPISFSMLSGAGLIKSNEKKVHVHTTTNTIVSAEGKIALTDALSFTDKESNICAAAPIFAMLTDSDGSLTGTIIELEADIADSDENHKKDTLVLKDKTTYANKAVFVDYYVIESGSDVSELQIDAENFAGYYYVEASTLFRRQSDGVDMPAEITFPNVKIQSNFTFSMASTGDPSTFTFTMDAFPGYTYFDQTKKVLCVIQVVENASGSTTTWNSVMTHNDSETEIMTTETDGVETDKDSYPYSI